MDPHDTRLARLLHQQGRLPLEQIQRLLLQTRAERARGPGATLADSLVQSQLLQPGEVEACLRQLGALEATSASTSAWKAGAEVGPYLLEAQLGRGAMGSVFRARHQLTGRPAALKLVQPEDSASLDRFMREAEAQAQVDDHPNLLRVYETGSARGFAYLAMELAEGGDLEERLRERHRLPPREAAQLVAQLADALAHVHERGILHRDLKPANVFFDAEGVVKLGDFGLARGPGSQRLTLTGDVLGTPAYMSPEQAKGLHSEVDAKSDVFALGIVLYRCLTGELPFKGQGSIEILSRLISDDPQPPCALVEGLSPRLEAICLRALSKEPDKRPSAPELARALRGWDGAGEVAGAGASERRGVPLALFVVGLIGATLLGLAAGGLRPRSDSGAAETPRASEAPAKRGGFAAGAQVALELPTPPPEVEPLRVLEPKLGQALVVEQGGQLRLGFVIEQNEGRHGLYFCDRDGQWYDAPAGGFLTDGFGVGARVRYGLEEGVILRRHGPMALIHFKTAERRWRLVPELELLKGGWRPVRAEEEQAPVVIALWEEDETLYPGIVAEQLGELGWVFFLDGDEALLPLSKLRRRPLEAYDRVTVGKRADNQVLRRAGWFMVQLRLSGNDKARWVGLDRISLKLE